MLFSDKYNKMAEFLSKIYFTVKKYPREPSETFRNNRWPPKLHFKNPFKCWNLSFFRRKCWRISHSLSDLCIYLSEDGRIYLECENNETEIVKCEVKHILKFDKNRSEINSRNENLLTCLCISRSSGEVWRHWALTSRFNISCGEAGHGNKEQGGEEREEKGGDSPHRHVTILTCTVHKCKKLWF